MANKRNAFKAKRVNTKNEKSGKKVFNEDTEEFGEAISLAQSWAHKYSNLDEIPDQLVPKEWDFRNINGYDFTGPVRD